MTDPAQTRPARLSVTARAPLIDDLTVPPEAARIVLFECLAHIGANVEPAVANRAPEALHQVRVGLRRLRVALENFSTGEAPARDLMKRGKVLTNGLGPARDLDVFLDGLFAPAAEQMAPVEGFDLLRERAGAARERAWQAAVDELASPSFKAFQDDVAALALDWGGALLLGPASAELLDTHLSKSRKRAKGLARKTAAERHRLRIALKKLRYTCEFFAPLYNPKKVEAFVAPLKELQDLLGHLNDAAQVRAVLGRVMMEEATSAREQADLSHAAGLIQGYHQARAEIVADKMLKRWKRFKKAEPFWI